MSASSPRQSAPGGLATAPVLPQTVTDPTILDSVAGFISEVVPAVAYNNVAPETKEHQVQWARFEPLDADGLPWTRGDAGEDEDDGNCAGSEKMQPPPSLVLVLGYASGIQVWSIPANGEAVCLLSWRHGSVRALRLLPPPKVSAARTNDKRSPDAFANTRPLIAICDNATPNAPPFSSVSFVSLKSGNQVKQLRFQNQVLDVVANKRSVVITFSERIAVFDALTLEDRLTVTTCYPSPGLYGNPVALGARWLAFAENRLWPGRRSAGGNEGEGIHSYTATVLQAAKSLGRGLRELGETVASSLTGTNCKPSSSANTSTCASTSSATYAGGQEIQQKGIVTVVDIESSAIAQKSLRPEAMIAHFIAHTDAIVCMAFDASGMLLLTADKRGHDFHLFRIHPHPSGPQLAAVHHLYILHRGDTTARVQDIAFSSDSRWAAVSTLRGTTHVFPVTPYGGQVGVRTHATPHVVNKMSRFHRSAGLSSECSSSATGSSSSAGGGPGVASTGGVGRSGSPAVAMFDSQTANGRIPHHNPRLPPFPAPTPIVALAQIRQPAVMLHMLPAGVTACGGGSAGGGGGSQSQGVAGGGSGTVGANGGLAGRHSTGRQRLGSHSEDGGQVAMRVSGCFAAARAWLEPAVGRDSTPNLTGTTPIIRPIESLFIMSSHGALLQYDLDPHHVTNIPRERICDDTSIELTVSARAQWLLQRSAHNTHDLQLPMSAPLLAHVYREPAVYRADKPDHNDDRWLAQVEIVTHAGPHRRLWMGPQFQFNTYQNGSGAPMTISNAQSIDVGRSKPVNMPRNTPYPILIEAGSVSSCEPSPKLFETPANTAVANQQHHAHHRFDELAIDGGSSDGSGAFNSGDVQLREDLADAMLESPGIREAGGGRSVVVSLKPAAASSSSSSPLHHARLVHPHGNVVTVPMDDSPPPPTGTEGRRHDVAALPVAGASSGGGEPYVYANCDESRFRPVVVANKGIVYAEPICLEAKDTACNTIHVDTSRTVHHAASSKARNKKQKKEDPPPLIIEKATIVFEQQADEDDDEAIDIVSSLENSFSENNAVVAQVVDVASPKLMYDFASDVHCTLAANVADTHEEMSDNHPRDESVSRESTPPPPSTVFKYDRYQGLSVRDIVTKELTPPPPSTQQHRSSGNKTRKPKVKLGVRIQRQQDPLPHATSTDEPDPWLVQSDSMTTPTFDDDNNDGDDWGDTTPASVLHDDWHIDDFPQLGSARSNKSKSPEVNSRTVPGPSCWSALLKPMNPAFSDDRQQVSSEDEQLQKRSPSSKHVSSTSDEDKASSSSPGESDESPPMTTTPPLGTDSGSGGNDESAQALQTSGGGATSSVAAGRNGKVGNGKRKLKHKRR